MKVSAMNAHAIRAAKKGLMVSRPFGSLFRSLLDRIARAMGRVARTIGRVALANRARRPRPWRAFQGPRRSFAAGRGRNGVGLWPRGDPVLP